MTPIYFNSSFNDQHEHQFFSPSDQQNEHQFLSPNSQAYSSSNSLTCHLFLNPNSHDQDGVFHKESQAPQHEGDNFGSQEYNDHHVESQGERGSNSNNGGLKFSLWKRETCNMNDENQVKWMSSKVRVMLKMKKSDPTGLNSFRSTATEVKLEDHQDHKHPRSAISPMEETANSNSINSTSSNNIPIRVCSDCNTTKTPLWRSGPQGPKSLCNACGIRQRKARKAMAAAAAAAAAETSNNVFHDKPTPLKATKILHKDHKKPKNGHLTKYKKRPYSKQITTPSPSSSSPARRNCVEEFLVSLSKNLAFHRVFPQDEKEAAILLMALSYGYVHE